MPDDRADEYRPEEYKQSESEAGEPSADPEEWWSWSNFARLFVFPLIIVIVAVGIYGFFQFLMQDGRRVQDYVAEIQTGPENHRWRAAYDLAQHVQYREGQDFTESSAEDVVRIFRTAEDDQIKTYLALVLAELPTEASVDALEEGLQSETASVRESSVLALGRLNATESVDEIVPLLQDESYEVRRMAAFALGGIGDPSVVEDLKNTLDDSSIDVRLNTAIALSRLGSPAGEVVLLDYLERALNGELEDVNVEQRRNILNTAMEALAETQSEEAVPLLRELQDEDPDSAVRRTALEARQTIQEGES